MRRASIFFLSVVVASTFVFINVPKTANACDCTARKMAIQEWIEAKAVFSGTVTKVEPISDGTNSVTVQVDRNWKGSASGFTKLETPSTGLGCGFPFERGQAYLIYADQTGEGYYTNACSRTALLSDADADMFTFYAVPAILLIILIVIIRLIFRRLLRRPY